jgi:Zn-finger nucleic acid-binding protein
MKQLSEPLSTGEMIPGAASSPAAPAQSRPIDLTKDIQRPTFDTATTNRLQAAPGAYEEAMKRLVPQKQMTATFNGQQFTAQPQARMDRAELEKLIARKQLDEQKSIADADIQKGRDTQMAMARIPGESASALQKVKNEGELANTGLLNERAKALAQLQYANNDVERQVAQTKVKQIEQQMAQADTTFKDQQARRPTPGQEMADKGLGDIVQQAAANPIILQDAATKAAYDQLLANASPTAQASAGLANAMRPAQADAAKAEGMRTIASDPHLQALIGKIKDSTPGILTGLQGENAYRNNKKMAYEYANRIARTYGLGSDEVLKIVQSMID